MNLGNKYLRAWLSFNTSPTEDALMNNWTTYGTPTIGTEHAFNGKALQLDGQSYIKLSGIELGGKDFYIDGWVYVDSKSPDYARVLHIENDSGYALVSVRKSATDSTKLDFWANSTADVSKGYGYVYTSSINSVGERVHFKLIYRYEDKRFSFCINDKIAADWTSNVVQYNRQKFDIYIGALSNGGQGVIGAIDELRIYDGTWFTYNKGTPPTLDEYREIIFTADVERKINNRVNVEFDLDVRRVLKWRYENSGDADDLILDSTILTDLPITQSQTSTAFYQTTRAKCFDLPATDEVWIKFDIYFDGTNRWRAYNDSGNNELNGISAQQTNSATGILSFFSSSSSSVYQGAGVTKKNQLQSVLLHMKSGTSSGVIEAWVDGEKIYTYTGDVNHGEDFADIYLQSDGAGTFFSNVIISNAEIKLGEGYHAFSLDTERIIETDAHLDEIFNALKVWLPFDKSPTFDLMDNTWTTSGNPTISDNALQLDGSSTLKLKGSLELGGQDFTVDAYVFMKSDSKSQSEIFYIGTSAGFLTIVCGDSSDSSKLCFWINQNATITSSRGYNPTASISSVGKRVHVELVYRYTAKTMTLYIDGVQAAQRTNCPQFTRANFSVAIGQDGFVGSIDEFRIFDGLALHTAKFIPPSKSYYDFLKPIPREKNFSVDVERRIKNIVEVLADVERVVTKPIVVPFIGEHFNHFVKSVKLFRDSPQRIILPKKSVVYIRATGDGALKVFSDVDSEGKKTGEIYAQLGECETVFLKPVDSPLRVIRDFVHSLDETTLSGTAALDEAINYCTRGIFDNRSAVVEKFMNDLSGFGTFGDRDFLQDYCDIDLLNADTGAITGIDAGGGGEKTSKSIVPEPIPVEDWIVPASGISTTIRGLTVNFPTSGANGVLTNVEKHILAGLNSVWIEQALILVEKSFGLSFRDEGATVKTINVQFENNSTNSALASTAYTVDTSSGKTVALRLVINMWHYDSIDIESVDGAAPYTLYLDRTLAHELTHAVMAANIDNFNSLPAFIKEGIAELVHGIDSTRRSEILKLVTSERSDLQTVISGKNPEAINTTFYSAGYLFLRYLAKQGQNDSFAPATLEITDLLISDGATDLNYNALTDNTRKLFSADVLRTLIKSVEPAFDVAIFDTIPVEVNLDVRRAILAKLILFPTSSEDFFADENNPFLRKNFQKTKKFLQAEKPTNTKGLQSFEVTLAEQQITDQVKFTGIIPFDIMQQVSGQYFDYVYNMRVERVQQQGILFSCDCCSDVDKLLFTQMAYKLPPSTTWHKSGEDNQTQQIKTFYPPASAHVKKIASALGLSPVMQFEDFLSTVLMDELGGVTYNDLIRDVFGWSARVPTQLINVFIRDENLFVVERGHESHSIDISDADKTLPIVTKELVRTSWGSTLWSKTENREDTLREFVPADEVIDEGGEDKDDQAREVSTQFQGTDIQGYTTYSYDKAGLLTGTYTYSRKNSTGQVTTTTVKHFYDSDKTMTGTETFTQSTGEEGNSASKSVEEKGYVTLANGEKFLAWEYSATYKNDSGLDITENDLIDYKYTTHSPSRVGQSHTITVSSDGEVVGAVAGQNTGDDRVTPFATKKAQDLSAQWDSDSGTWKTQTENWERTITGLSLYDSSFPIHNEDKLIQVTKALRNLNRKTRETVNVTIYDFEHLIDFNDKIILNGAEYFLVSNTARTTPRIKFEQNLTLVRWY